MTRSRTELRAGFTPEQRISLLEQDTDSHEAQVVAMNARLGKILTVCVSLLVSTTTAILVLALNLVVGR